MRNYTKLLDLAKDSNGYIFTSDVVENDIPKSYLAFAVKDKVIEKIARGIYILPENFVDDLFVLQRQNLKIVYSAFTSAYLLGLTTRDAEKVYASIPNEYNPHLLKKKGVFIREDLSTYQLGITKVKTVFDNYVVCHDIHRTICDLFNTKYYGDKFVQVEALKNYIRSKEKDITKLMTYAKQLGVDNEIRDKLEVLL